MKKVLFDTNIILDIALKSSLGDSYVGSQLCFKSFVQKFWTS